VYWLEPISRQGTPIVTAYPIVRRQCVDWDHNGDVILQTLEPLWFHDQLNDDVMQDIRNPYFEYFMTDDII